MELMQGVEVKTDESRERPGDRDEVEQDRLAPDPERPDPCREVVVLRGGLGARWKSHETVRWPILAHRLWQLGRRLRRPRDRQRDPRPDSAPRNDDQHLGDPHRLKDKLKSEVVNANRVVLRRVLRRVAEIKLPISSRAQFVVPVTVELVSI